MLLQEHSSCLRSGENGKPFCLDKLWPALIVRVHWDLSLTPSTRSKIQKKLFWFYTRASKFISAPRKDKHFIGQLWRLITASNVVAWTQAWQSKWTVFKIEGLACKRFVPFFPAPPRSFTCAIFRAVFHFCSSFFTPKPHRNACYAGYI